MEGEQVMGQEEFQTLLQFFKVLGDETRLKMVGILAGRECSVEELAATLGVREPTVSHHLAKLKGLGLVRMRAEGTTHLYRLDAEALRAANKDLLARETLASLTDDVAGDAWQRKILRDFFEGERLKEIPASRKKRAVILAWLADRFAPDRRYREAEVNEIIKRHHPDTATLRRELIGGGWMAREAGVYWRLPASEDHRGGAEAQRAAEGDD
jgi:DNA-binding transcriptional ArsR family regulator